VPDVSPTPAGPARPGPTRLQRTTALVAAIGVVVALVGLGLLARPVSTPTQDCGATLLFLLDGRTNEFIDPNDPPTGVTPEEAVANNERPCRDRVADAARTPVVLVAAGLASALGALLVEVAARAWAWRQRVQERRGAPVDPFRSA
jgi:hypothetical protein